MFAGNFAPAGWAFCNGALMPIAENDALFVLIGTIYGGDGEETFALPNLSSRMPLHHGTRQGSGVNYVIGEAGGVESVTLTTNQIPIHSHVPLASSAPGNAPPTNSVWATSATSIYSTAAPDVNMAATAVGPTGGSQPHDNMMPFLVVSFIISLFGVFPSQT